MQLITEPTWLECSVTERSSAHSEKHHNTGSAQVYLFTHDECMSLRATSHCVFDSAGRQGQSWAYFFVFFFCSESLCIYTKKKSVSVERLGTFDSNFILHSSQSDSFHVRNVSIFYHVFSFGGQLSMSRSWQTPMGSVSIRCCSHKSCCSRQPRCCSSL